MGSESLDEELKIMKLEIEVEGIKKALDEMKIVHKSMDQKLDSLLALKHKGAGAFWAASIIFGTSIIGLVSWFFDLFKHS